ncbi:MAG TPA: hypothetical protein VES68_01335 [Candidatus Sulfotelmatobacter sp.]|nr:hypothetical protein [Candidatus Sulfotelmatobacter sp.]
MNYTDLPKLSTIKPVVVEKKIETSKNKNSNYPEPHPLGYTFFGTASSTATGPSQQMVSVTHIAFEGYNPYETNRILVNKSLSELINNLDKQNS